MNAVRMSVGDEDEVKEGEEENVLPPPTHSFAVKVEPPFTLPDCRALRELSLEDEDGEGRDESVASLLTPPPPKALFVKS